MAQKAIPTTLKSSKGIAGYNHNGTLFN